MSEINNNSKVKNQTRRQSSCSQMNTSQDQRASSTIEEGIMGLKYLPPHQATESAGTQNANNNLVVGKEEQVPSDDLGNTNGATVPKEAIVVK